ncbi:hypothetical protein NP233_g6005 [Leucocoprinus birnbaumii]|uniref:Homeobox domain-containing protein n=1 Tax=Leucocoprinus birnbaumii TaxID=56174 RepID=A0AAD5YVY0_9AGAR|nr:hypothetical protein NP233_g6005 [Leucocoprinus birnbaumii]
MSTAVEIMTTTSEALNKHKTTYRHHPPATSCAPHSILPELLEIGLSPSESRDLSQTFDQTVSSLRQGAEAIIAWTASIVKQQSTSEKSSARSCHEDTPVNSAAPYIKHSYAWLMKHLHNPYPSKETREIIAQESGCDPRHVENWFIDVRKRIGWGAIRKQYFANKRSRTVDAATAFLKTSSQSTLPDAICGEFAKMVSRAEEMYGGKFATISPQAQPEEHMEALGRGIERHSASTSRPISPPVSPSNATYKPSSDEAHRIGRKRARSPESSLWTSTDPVSKKRMKMTSDHILSPHPRSVTSNQVISEYSVSDKPPTPQAASVPLVGVATANGESIRPSLSSHRVASSPPEQFWSKPMMCLDTVRASHSRPSSFSAPTSDSSVMESSPCPANFHDATDPYSKGHLHTEKGLPLQSSSCQGPQQLGESTLTFEPPTSATCEDLVGGIEASLFIPGLNDISFSDFTAMDPLTAELSDSLLGDQILEGHGDDSIIDALTLESLISLSALASGGGNGIGTIVDDALEFSPSVLWRYLSVCQLVPSSPAWDEVSQDEHEGQRPANP